MTIREAKTWAIGELRRRDAEAAIDAEILLGHSLGISREELLAHDERRVPAPAMRRFRSLVARRRRHEPTAYLIGHREFFGLQFAVNKHTLIPRPETEQLVEEVLAMAKSANNGPRATGQALVIDVGTGSGAIAVAVAKNSDAAVIATDTSKSALRTAERNAEANGVGDRIDFRRADLLAAKRAKRGQTPLFSKIMGSVPLIIAANLPYIPTADWRKCMPEVKDFEPRTALDGGKDGLDFYDHLLHQIAAIRRLPQPDKAGKSASRHEFGRREHAPAGRLNFSQAAEFGHAGQSISIICELDPSQKKSFPKLVKKHFPDAAVEIKNDLAKRPRFAIVNL